MTQTRLQVVFGHTKIKTKKAEKAQVCTIKAEVLLISYVFAFHKLSIGLNLTSVNGSNSERVKALRNWGQYKSKYA